MRPTLITLANREHYISQARLRAHATDARDYQGCQARRSIYGSLPNTKRVKDVFTVPKQSEWADILRADTDPTLADLSRANLPVHDQKKSSFCWIFGTVRSLELTALYEQQLVTRYNPWWTANKATAGTNRGGSADEAMAVVQAHGSPLEDLYPIDTWSTNLGSQACQEDAERHAILEHFDAQDIEDIFALLQHRIPCPVGLEWWGHLVCFTRALIHTDGQVVFEIDNSWGPNWEDQGRGLLDIEHARPTYGCLAPIAATFAR
jgi:C1A family cysteine protease